MKDLEIVRAILTQNAPLVVLVGADMANIVAGPLEVGQAAPAVGLAHISTTRPQMLKKALGIATSRVQIVAIGRTFDEPKTIITAAILAASRKTGTYAAAWVESVLLDVEGPDFVDDAGVYYSSIDVIVTYHE